MPPTGHAGRPAADGTRVDTERGDPGGHGLGRTLGDLGVQGVDRGPFRPQRRYLADHEHALTALSLGVDGDQPVTLATQPLARDPQPAEVETFQLLPHLRTGQPPLEQFGLSFVKGANEVRLHTPGGVSWRCLQQHGAVAVHRGLLEPGQDRTGFNRLGGEQVGGTHQHPDAGAAFGQWRRGCRNHGRGPLIMHAAGEQHMHTLEELAAGLLPALVGHPFAVGQQPRDLALPQREARAWAYVATALASLEDELAGTVSEKSTKQTG